MSDHGPVEEKHAAALYAVGCAIRDEFPDIGFCVLMFDFGEAGRVNYLSNASREHMIRAMKEFVANAEADMAKNRGTPQ